VSQPLPEPIQFGKYTLYERIGRGGMADVFKGRIQGPGGFERVFVVKRILPHLSDDQAFVKMFVEEAKLSARLNHPNIVQIFELGSVEGEFFISMEHVPGHDLAETMRALWKAWGPPRPDMVAYVGREMCRALGYAHALRDDAGNLLGMIHRDVSPSNVMLSYEGAVKLLDFGIAKALGDAPEVTKSGTLKGKYAYMAPEQTEGDDVDARIDIFAAGIVMHEVLSGRRLFKAQNDIQTIERVRRCEVRPPSQFNPAVSPALDAVVLKALARNRDDRFQSANEMADALDDVVHEAHFTPQILAAILRETFGGEGTPSGAHVTDRRLASSITNTSLSTTTSSGTARSPTVPPIALGSRRATGQMAAVSLQSPAETVDSAAIKAIRGRPLLKRGSFWVVASLCAAGIGVGVFKGVRLPSGPATPTAVQIDPRPAAAAAPVTKAKRTPVLIQTEPEGADLYVAGRLESLGRTPVWVTLELAPDSPARVMVRKPGFQDKAIAVESERPPVVRMIPVGAAAPDEPTVEPVAAQRPTADNAAAATGERAKNAGAKAAQRQAPARRGKSEIVDPF
jgi:serine/threonine protein kinase